MSEPQQVPAVLLLEDGTVFHGKSAGMIGTATGEICFNTGMTGYQEIFTDPSYFGQLMVTTNVHIGNYGTKRTEAESYSIKIAGLICKNYNIEYHRPMADMSIQEYFEEEKLVGICEVDTRAIVLSTKQTFKDRAAAEARAALGATGDPLLRGRLLMRLGRFEEALAEARRASPSPRQALLEAGALTFLGRYAELEEQLRGGEGWRPPADPDRWEAKILQRRAVLMQGLGIEE